MCQENCEQPGCQGLALCNYLLGPASEKWPESAAFLECDLIARLCFRSPVQPVGV